MNKSSRGLFLIALILAMLGAGVLYLYLQSLETPVAVEVDTVEIVVAAVDIPANTIVTETMLMKIAVPQEAQIGQVIYELSDAVGLYTKVTIFKDQRIHPNALVRENEGRLSMHIKGDQRAISLPVNGSTGVSNLIQIGDFVDVIVYLPQLTEQSRIIRPDITKMILQRIEVLAIDRNMDMFREDDDTEIKSYHVTLAVPARHIEAFVLAKDIGIVDLALRPLEDDRVYVTSGIIWQELLLNDAGLIKDFFPEYNIFGNEAEEGAEITSSVTYDEYVYYTVQYGDTLRSISRKFYNTEQYYNLIGWINRIDDEDFIIAGSGIKIPILLEGGDSNGN